MKKQREKFGSRLGFILVSAGCAVGLGNVWKFPYICGQYGGAAFILIYLIFLVILGIPCLMAEMALGRGSRQSISMAFDELENDGEKWHWSKWMSIIGNYMLMMFYTMVCGWMINYMFKMGSGQLSGLAPDAVADNFGQMLANPGELIFWTVLSCVIAFAICAKGLRGGIEKITKVMMIVLIILMAVLAVNSLLLPGADEGIRFYLVPDFKKLMDNGIGEAVFAAMTHAFFTLSIGIGSMEIFGSYMEKDRTLTGECINIVGVDTLVALMAGIIIIPACFAYNVTPGAGPSLLFITLPNVFNNMPGGRIWGTLFFLFMTFAALSTVIAVYENIIAFFIDGLDWTRRKAVIFNIVAIIVLSLPAVLGFNILSGVEPLGPGTGIMDLEDFIVSYNLLPLGSLTFILFATRKNGWGYDNFLTELNTGEGMKTGGGFKPYLTFILPLIIVVVYLKGYWDMFYDPADIGKLIGWMVFAAVLLAFIFLIASGVLNRNKNKQTA
ncbi:MAG: sodium-dependent transporter [Lachnospiraceae bacterium]|nr:sodium-dependent transporter [Lachnospiraceae bacterium]